MAWKMLGKPYATADMSGAPTISQKVKTNDNVVLLAARAGIIEYGNPSYTTLTMKIYSDNAGSPFKLLYTSSTSWTPALVSTLNHAYKELYFTFSKPTLHGSDYYHFVLSAAGYTGTSASHLAWKSGWTDPIFKTGVTVLQTKAAKMPFDLSLISSDLQ